MMSDKTSLIKRKRKERLLNNSVCEVQESTVKKFTKRKNVNLFTGLSHVQAGFPSPAEDMDNGILDLNEFLVKNPDDTFLIRVKGNSMNDIGIHDGDMLIVDRSIKVLSGDIIIAVLDGEFTVKRIIINDEGIYLSPENPLFTTIKVDITRDFYVWGIVLYSIHKIQNT